MVGYQDNDLLKKTILKNSARLSEIYFPWKNFTTGRGLLDENANSEGSCFQNDSGINTFGKEKQVVTGHSQEQRADHQEDPTANGPANSETSITQGQTVQARLESALDEFYAVGLGFNLLLNGNCYGAISQERAFFQAIGDAVDWLQQRYRLGSVTTTSPLIARFLRMNFDEIEIRASVNMEIGTPEAMNYIVDLFDGFYLKREYNRDWDRIIEMRRWCDCHGKKLYLLANSGCLNFCPLRTFHDNLVAHQHEIASRDNAFEFPGICHDFLARPENRSKILSMMNFVRPEDLERYAPYFDGVKLATRTSRNPSGILTAYLKGRYSGNLLDLTEPSHSGHFYPAILANDRIPEDFAERILHCDKNCDDCGYCAEVARLAKVDLTTISLPSGGTHAKARGELKREN